MYMYINKYILYTHTYKERKDVIHQTGQLCMRIVEMETLIYLQYLSSLSF